MLLNVDVCEGVSEAGGFGGGCPYQEQGLGASKLAVVLLLRATHPPACAQHDGCCAGLIQVVHQACLEVWVSEVVHTQAVAACAQHAQHAQHAGHTGAG